jgi:hypothetical protein
LHDYSRKSKVAHCEILAPQDAPVWVFDREELWNQVEATEKRRDSQVAREINVALPIEKINAELARLVAEIAADEWRLNAGQTIREVADFVLATAKQESLQGERFSLSYDLVQTADGRRLVAGRGDALVVRDDLQKQDLVFFEFQRQRLREWLALEARRQDLSTKQKRKHVER